MIVSPVLQVTAEIAAVRGDRDLYNDMASMMALLILVRTLGGLYLQQPGAAADASDAVDAAPMAACTMVLQRGELTREQVGDCLWALQAATQELADAQVLGREQRPAHEAWQFLLAGNRKHAIECLKQAAVSIVMDVDKWERDREARTRPEP